MTSEQVLVRLRKLANTKSVEAAERIASIDSRAARWIAADALKELLGEKVREKLRRKVTKR